VPRTTSSSGGTLSPKISLQSGLKR
jgi:hypothetical protein